MSDDARIGTVAPDFALESADGERITLASRRGRSVVLFFVREFS